jgi:hypothetical protein
MMNADEKLVVIEQYESAESAHIDRIVLEEAGLWSVLEDEYVVSTNWFYTIPGGGVKLLVRQSDFEQARQVMLEIQAGAVTTDSLPQEENDLACPACGSWNVHFETYSRIEFFLTILLFKFPFAAKTNRAVCCQCGHVWKQL